MAVTPVSVAATGPDRVEAVASGQLQPSLEDPETADEFLQAFNDLRGTEAFATYSEFELVRSQAVVELQTDSFSAADRERLRHLLEALTAFDRAYELSADGETIASVDATDEVAAHLDALADAGGDEYARLGEIALSRFYEQQGSDLYDRSRTIDATTDRLDVLAQAATAYERAGTTERYAAIRLEHDELESAYESDMERYEAAVSGSEAFLEDCTAACRGGVGDVLTSSPASLPFGPFEAYTDAQQAHADAVMAAEIAESHADDEQVQSVTAIREETLEAMVTAGLASTALVAGYLVGALALALAIVWRLSAWKRDVRDARIDDVVAERGGGGTGA